VAILVDADTRVLVQGITGNQGAFHTGQMLAYGTHVVAGTSRGRSGQNVHGVPVYDTVEEAVARHAPTASVIFVPAPFAKDAAFEAIAAGIKLLVVITEHILVHDAMDIMAFAAWRGATVVGPNTFGIILDFEGLRASGGA
jgi:succinyl-CoA synthetase alpha subunit